LPGGPYERNWQEPVKELGLGFGILLFATHQELYLSGGNGGPRVNKKGKEVDFDLLFQKISAFPRLGNSYGIWEFHGWFDYSG